MKFFSYFHFKPKHKIFIGGAAQFAQAHETILTFIYTNFCVLIRHRLR